MSNYLQRYLPEYDEEGARQRLAGFGAEDLREMVIRAYKEKRILLKMLAESDAKLKQIEAVLQQPSVLSSMPDVPSGDDLRRMMDDDSNHPEP